jgi:hypothetical protein
MINKSINCLHALNSLPFATQVSLDQPHQLTDYNGMRAFNKAAQKENINTEITTDLEPLNQYHHKAKRVYHVFKFPGARKVSGNAGKKRPFVNRPRPLVMIPAVVAVTKPYRKHCGGHK